MEYEQDYLIGVIGNANCLICLGLRLPVLLSDKRCTYSFGLRQLYMSSQTELLNVVALIFLPPRRRLRQHVLLWKWGFTVNITRAEKTHNSHRDFMNALCSQLLHSKDRDQSLPTEGLSCAHEHIQQKAYGRCE